MGPLIIALSALAAGGLLAGGKKRPQQNNQNYRYQQPQQIVSPQPQPVKKLSKKQKRKAKRKKFFKNLSFDWKNAGNVFSEAKGLYSGYKSSKVSGNEVEENILG